MPYYCKAKNFYDFTYFLFQLIHGEILEHSGYTMVKVKNPEEIIKMVTSTDYSNLSNSINTASA
ncbi:hypothetical protein LCGC14_0911190 [marine sediment metagenome]|uniref:Uncharacterized protein n=1 Tax=marine sediment metagenome TaxID=412755 RepID=A0A0F9NYA7_9ZZZZ|nr:MAG: hypothetical protein Lokiarch_28400 [Candidatus Lokiarchaeum sp. GC14_75]